MRKSTDIKNVASHHELVISDTCKLHANETFICLFPPNQIRDIFVTLMVNTHIRMSFRRVEGLIGLYLSHSVSKWNRKPMEFNLSIYDCILFRNTVRNLITTTVTLMESHSCCGLWKNYFRIYYGSFLLIIYKGHQRSTRHLFFCTEQIYIWRIPSCFYSFFFFFFVDLTTNSNRARLLGEFALWWLLWVTFV